MEWMKLLSLYTDYSTRPHRVNWMLVWGSVFSQCYDVLKLWMNFVLWRNPCVNVTNLTLIRFEQEGKKSQQKSVAPTKSSHRCRVNKGINLYWLNPRACTNLHISLLIFQIFTELSEYVLFCFRQKRNTTKSKLKVMHSFCLTNVIHFVFSSRNLCFSLKSQNFNS